MTTETYSLSESFREELLEFCKGRVIEICQDDFIELIEKGVGCYHKAIHSNPIEPQKKISLLKKLKKMTELAIELSDESRELEIVWNDIDFIYDFFNRESNPFESLLPDFKEGLSEHRENLKCLIKSIDELVKSYSPSRSSSKFKSKEQILVLYSIDAMQKYSEKHFNISGEKGSILPRLLMIVLNELSTNSDFGDIGYVDDVTFTESLPITIIRKYNKNPDKVIVHGVSS